MGDWPKNRWIIGGEVARWSQNDTHACMHARAHTHTLHTSLSLISFSYVYKEGS